VRSGQAQRARLFLHRALAEHWGDSGGTPEGKDGEIRVRTGKFKFHPWLGCGAPTLRARASGRPVSSCSDSTARIGAKSSEKDFM
jgi:hypothetical protein